MIWKIASAVTVVLAASTAASAGIFMWLTFATPNPDTDYVQVLNDPIETIPVDQRAWPLWRDVLPKFTRITHDAKNASYQVHYPARLEDPEQQAAVDAWLAENADLLPAIYEAASFPYSGFIYGQPETRAFIAALVRRNGQPEIDFGDAVDNRYVPKLMSILLPAVAEYRDVGRYLVLYARSRLYEGDFVEAVHALDAARQLGIQQIRSYTVVEQVAGVAIVGLAADEWFSMLYYAGPSLPPEAVEAVRDSGWMLEETEQVGSLSYETERLMFEDVVQYAFTDDGAGNGRLIPWEYQMLVVSPGSDGATSELAAVMTAAMHADRRETVAFYNRAFDAMVNKSRLPLDDPAHWSIETDYEALFADPLVARRFKLVQTMLPLLLRADTIMTESNMTRDAARAAGAITLYMHDFGRYPRSFDEVVPDYLHKPPLDVYANQPLKYKVTGEAGVVLYSIGGNFQDDGASVEKVAHKYVDRKIHADIVYWPPAGQ